MSTNRPFIAGLEPSRTLFDDAIELLLNAHVPALRYTAGLIGSGLDVLSPDTERSTNPGWGP